MDSSDSDSDYEKPLPSLVDKNNNTNNFDHDQPSSDDDVDYDPQKPLPTTPPRQEQTPMFGIPNQTQDQTPLVLTGSFHPSQSEPPPSVAPVQTQASVPNQAVAPIPTMNQNYGANLIAMESAELEIDINQNENMKEGTMIKSGWLTKQGGRRKNWKKRWFVLKKGSLTYFEDESKSKELGTIPLGPKSFIIHDVREDGSDSDSDDEKANMSGKPQTTTVTKFGRLRSSKKNQKVSKSMQKKIQSATNQFEIGVPGRVYVLKSLTAEEKKTWVSSVQSALVNPNMSGYLTKQGFSRPTWKLRWFVLDKESNPPVLNYFKSPSETGTPLGSIPMTEVDVKECDGKIGVRNSFVVSTPSRNYYMFASNQITSRRWMSAIRRVVAEYTSLPIPFIRGHIQYGGQVDNGTTTTWLDYYAELRRRYLFIYGNHKDIQTKHVIDLKGCEPTLCEFEEYNRPCVIKISTQAASVFLLGCDNRFEAKQWHNGFETVVDALARKHSVHGYNNGEDSSLSVAEKRKSYAPKRGAGANLAKLAKSKDFRASLAGLKPINLPD